MTPYQITVVELRDLTEVSVTCTTCKTRLTLPIETGLLPDQCPSCNKVLDDHLKTAFTALGRFMREGKAAESRIELPIQGQTGTKT